MGREPVIQEYERIHDGPPLEPRTVTLDDFRHVPDEELEQRRLKAQVERSERFRKLYEAMDLRVVGHKDGTLEVFWGRLALFRVARAWARAASVRVPSRPLMRTFR